MAQKKYERKAEKPHNDGRRARQYIHGQTDAPGLTRRSKFRQIQTAAHAGKKSQRHGQAHEIQGSRAGWPQSVPHRAASQQGVQGRHVAKKQMAAQLRSALDCQKAQ